MLALMDGTPQPEVMSQMTSQVPGENAVQIAAHSLPATAASPAQARSLDQLSKGEQAVVVSVEASAAFGTLDALVTRRLWELGFLAGAQISVVGFGLLSRDPIAVKIGSTKFALRRAEAQKVQVRCSEKLEAESTL
jgi:ferrous iron transport protein A